MGFLLAILAIVIVVSLYLAFDRRRYHGAPPPGAPGTGGDLRPTSEVFRDPGTGKMMRVYEDPRTGARHYRPEE